MPTMHSVTEKIRAIRPLYLQILFVALAFIGMVVSSNYYVSDMLRENLRRDAVEHLTQTKLKIEAELLEPETVLTVISATMREMILQGCDADAIHGYMLTMAETLQNKTKGFTFDGLHGYFDVFGGRYMTTASTWEIPKDYDPTKRPWYAAAVAAGDKTAVTPIYMNVRLNAYMITYTRRLFDQNGQPLAVVCLNVPLDDIIHFVADMRLTKGGYGVFHDEKLNIFAHPSPEAIGKNAREMGGDLPRFMEEVMVGGVLFEREATNYEGALTIIFSMRLKNGWLLYTVTPKAEYYQQLYRMMLALGILGACLAAVLSIILLRVDLAKKRSDEESRQKSLLLTAIEKEREADERTQRMLNATPLGCKLWDRNFTLIDCNQEALNLFDLQDKQAFFDRFYECSPEYQPDGRLSKELAAEYLRKAFDESSCRFEWMHQKLDGEPIPSEVTLVRIKHKNEYVVAGYIRDLRELKAMLNEMRGVEQELRWARDAAQAANQAKSAFLAKMSHEIRTPMNAILGITEIQLMDETLAPGMREALGQVYNSGDLLLGIINDILDMSKIEAGKLELLATEYDTASLINDTAHLNMMRFENKPIAFELDVDENTPAVVCGDMLRVKQILNNVLSNAFKYTAEGMVTLSVSHEPGNGMESDVTLVFTIRDTGQGMTEEQISKLFDEYSRFNQEANRATEGTGLGMSITRHLVNLMHGEIIVESEPGRGSVFTVRLPQKNAGPGVLGRELAEKLRQFRISSAAHIKKLHIVRDPMPYGRVLVVDDVETNLYVAQGILAPYGLAVTLAGSGFEAIEHIKRGEAYDIVFMDHMMPDMDGMETTEAIRGLGYTRPIVALTANAVIGQAELFRERGFDEFISKPIDIRQMNAVLNKFVRDRQPPEVVEAARRQKNAANRDAADATPAPLAPKLTKAFIRDASKSVTVLAALCAKQGAHTNADLQRYVVNVHGMKSALANIGEGELASLADRLEQAGREHDSATMATQTPEFLNALRQVIEKVTPKEDGETCTAADEDRICLREKLLALRAACVAYNKKTAKDVLADLDQKTWSPATRERLDTVAERLLHSKFKEIVSLVDAMIPVLSDPEN